MKMKKLLFAILTVIALIGAISCTVFAETALQMDADGAYLVGSADDMLDLNANFDNIVKHQQNVTVKLTSNIDMKDVEWTPIDSPWDTHVIFTLDGQGYTVSNLTVVADDLAGLFASFDENDILNVKNLTMDGASITRTGDNDSYKHAGVIIGQLAGHVNYAENPEKYTNVFENVVVKNSTVTSADEYAAAMVGYTSNASTEFINCAVENTTLVGDSRKCGGFIGYTTVPIIVEDCSVTSLTTPGGLVAGRINTANAIVTVKALTTDSESSLYGENYSNLGTVIETPAVVEIGSKGYSTLAAAFANAKEGDTITLLDDVTVTEQITVLDSSLLSDITIDGNGKTISAGALDQSNTSVLYLGKASESVWCTGVKIKNLTIDVETARFGIFLCGGTSSVLENVTVKGDYLYGINLYGTHGAEMTNCNIVSMFSNAQDDYPLILENTTVGALYANSSEDSADAGKITINNSSTVEELFVWGGNTSVVGTGLENAEAVTALDDNNNAVAFVAEIDGVLYTTLQAAVDAAQDGDEIKLIKNTTGSGIQIRKSITIDFGGYAYTVDSTVGSSGTETLAFQILANSNAVPYDVTLKNGKISVEDDKYIKVVIMNYSNLTIDSVTIDGTGSSVMECGLATNNGSSTLKGDTNIYVNDGVYAAVDVDGSQDYYNAAKLKINTIGTIRGRVEIYGEEATAVINNGIFTDTVSVATEANVKIYGGTFSNDVSAYCAEGYELSTNENGTYCIISNLPKAEVNNLGAITVDKYRVYSGSLGSEITDKPLDLHIAMQFLAKDTEEEAEANVFGKYITDFYISVDGLSGDNFEGTGCYLAGEYGDWGWIVIPLDGMTIEEDKVYPVITSVGVWFTYIDVCTLVKEFNCGIYFSEAVTTANPDMKVTLTLGLSEDIESAVATDFITVDEPYTYGVEDFGKKVCRWTTATDAGYYLSGEQKVGMMRYLFHAGIEGEITDVGIKYIKGDDLTAKIEYVGEASKGDKEITDNAFYGDIVNIPEADYTDAAYYAIAYIVTDAGELWSEPVACTPNFTNHYTSLDKQEVSE